MEAGAEDANLIICVTTSDELNILAGLMAKKMGTRHTIARVRNPDYSSQRDFMRNQLGFSMIVKFVVFYLFLQLLKWILFQEEKLSLLNSLWKIIVV